jgi:hypothetical protein
MHPGGGFVDKFALALSQRSKVGVLVLFLELLEHLSPLHGLDQRLTRLTDFAFGARDALLLEIDVALDALQVRSEEQHVGDAEVLALFPALVLNAAATGVLLFP